MCPGGSCARAHGPHSRCLPLYRQPADDVDSSVAPSHWPAVRHPPHRSRSQGHALQLTTRLITRSNGMGNIQGEPTASAAARLLPLLLAVACEPDALISGCAVAAVRALAQALSPCSAKGAVVPALPTVPDAPAPKLTPRRSTRRGASADASPVSTAAANPAAAVPPASLPGAAEASSFPLLFTSGGGEVEAAEAYTATQARGRGQGSKGQATGCA